MGSCYISTSTELNYATEKKQEEQNINLDD